VNDVVDGVMTLLVALGTASQLRRRFAFHVERRA